MVTCGWKVKREIRMKTEPGQTWADRYGREFEIKQIVCDGVILKGWDDNGGVSYTKMIKKRTLKRLYKNVDGPWPPRKKQ